MGSSWGSRQQRTRLICPSMAQFFLTRPLWSQRVPVFARLMALKISCSSKESSLARTWILSPNVFQITFRKKVCFQYSQHSIVFNELIGYFYRWAEIQWGVILIVDVDFIIYRLAYLIFAAIPPKEAFNSDEFSLFLDASDLEPFKNTEMFKIYFLTTIPRAL